MTTLSLFTTQQDRQQIKILDQVATDYNYAVGGTLVFKPALQGMARTDAFNSEQFYIDGVAGVDNSFTSADGKTITVS